MKSKNKWIFPLCVICLGLVCAVGYTLCKEEKAKTEELETDLEEVSSGEIVVDGQPYFLNTNIQAVLFMGIDKEAKSELQGRPGENGQSDSLNLLVADRATGKAQILQISRDAMVEIDIYALSGEKILSEPGQIALQYAYGDGDKESCRLTTGKVSELLYGVEISSYLSLTMEGMVKVADAIGGVTLTIPEDYTWIDPAFEKGVTLTLSGEMVEAYVRTRDTEVLDSNVQRMERQSQFLAALIEKMQTMDDMSGYLSLYQQMEPYMVTNMTADEMAELAEYEISTDTQSVPGEVILKDGYAQFIVDNEELKNIVLKMFYN